MDKRTLENYCLKHIGVSHNYKEEWNADRYLVGGKIFAIIGEDPKEGKPLITLKNDPNQIEALREKYEGVIPGYFMHKVHWNSYFFDASIPDNLWEELIDQSYELVYRRLSKKIKEEISV
ncbi:MmcQ/YjbR family DNA-binding protein [Pontibacillus litoralis]|uniref:MmcQ n=1 Tax=Pontibacillus litoralis JSM 072002 TaxID=1385512 RepID=A0A0A5G8N5_9BACI|nr:MmcQ/YjbR family DNA-binding protein [Pontibacillus litoralis]KGX87513.1 MmcQ [Pontibacillus litoralis JSM 072002]